MDVREFRSDDDGVMSLHVSQSGDGIRVPASSAAHGREIYLSAGCPTTDDEECKWMLPMNEPRPKPAEMFRCCKYA